MGDQLLLLPANAPTADAVISQDGVYRYSLTRCAGWGKGVVNFVMLNPSTADAKLDDPTIRRCWGFTRKWGYGLLAVTNLYAYRATDPKALARAWANDIDVIGPENDGHIREWAKAELVVVAWGSHGMRKRAEAVHRLLLDARPGKRPLCLGHNRDGHPVHPLYQPAEAKLEPWRGFA